MTRKTIYHILFMLLVAVQGQAQTVKIYYHDGTLLKIPAEEVLSIVPYAPDHFYVDGHEYVDLGLSVCWATCNVGANSPEEYGGYYAWGELEEKEEYTFDAYKWGEQRRDSLTGWYRFYTKYYGGRNSYGQDGIVDNKICLDKEDDVAYIQWGNNWRIPTSDEQRELLKVCSTEYVEVNGVPCCKIIASNGNSIFFPLSGYKSYRYCELKNSEGIYTSATLDLLRDGSYTETYSADMRFSHDEFDHKNPNNIHTSFFESDRMYGNSIRPVTDIKPQRFIRITKTNGVEIDIPETELDSIVGFAGYPYGIPEDDEADPNPEIEDPNTNIPNPHGTVEWEGVDLIFRLDMTGIQDPNDPNTWLKLYGTGSAEQNLWVSIDDQPKGFSISNIDDETVPIDIVFLVDNSGSMSDEANVVARDILAWAQYLVDKNLDVKFGCVGYSENGKINGAFDMNDASALSTYLNKYTGTSRTMWFSGDNASALSSAAATYKVKNECGGMALQYADANLTFRDEANRIYVNFTDEPNQPNGVTAYSVEWFNSEKGNWPASKGTVHTVYSDGYNAIIVENPGYSEDPAKLSTYTGGTTIKTNSTLSGVSLNNLPITGALTNSYIIRMANVMGVADGNPHEVKITILSKDGSIRAERVFEIVIAPPTKED